MDIRGYYLYRVSYFILASGVGQSMVVAKTPEEAEGIIINCNAFSKYVKNRATNPIIQDVTRLYAVTHISPELLLEVFSPSSH